MESFIDLLISLFKGGKGKGKLPDLPSLPV